MSQQKFQKIVNELTEFRDVSVKYDLDDQLEKYEAFVKAVLAPGDYKHQLIHAAMGGVGEAAEYQDCIKKHVIYGQPLDDDNAIEEIGDEWFYLSLKMQLHSVSIRDVIRRNVLKLAKRYGKGQFSTQQSIDRADKAEGGEDRV